MRLAFDGAVVLDGVNLAVRPGDVVLLRGENGAGKTCLIDILTGVLEPTAGQVHLQRRGRAMALTFPGPAWRRLLRIRHSQPELFSQYGIGRSWQDIRLFEGLTVGANAAVGCRGQSGESLWGLFTNPLKVRREERCVRQRSSSFLRELNLSAVDAPASTLSCGQGRRLAIARTLLSEPSVLFLDEPLAGLDAKGAEEVMGLIRTVAQGGRIALVIVEHFFNVPWVLQVATEVWTLRGGKVSIDSPQDVRQEGASSAVNGLLGHIASIAGAGTSVSTTALPRGAALHVSARPDAGQGARLLEVIDLTVRRGQHMVVGEKDVRGRWTGASFEVRRGEIAILTAPNGWGKTTLVCGLAGLIRETLGQITIAGRPIASLPPWQRARAGLAVLQSGPNSFSELTVREVLRVAGVERPSLVRSSLMDRRVSTLSGGERQLVAIEAALRDGRFDVAILDEPFQSLDEPTIQRVCARLSELAADRAILMMLPRPLGEAGVDGIQEFDA